MIFTNNIDPVLLDFGVLQVRWYGVLFALGILLNYLVVRWAFKKEKLNLEDWDELVVYLFFGLVIGARLGHILFYNLEYFSNNPLEILKIWNGGLSSHGAAIGLFVAFYIWSKVKKLSMKKYMDLAVLGMPLTAGFVRIGNFFNSEIVGIKSENFGVIFKKLGEDFPRHPAQLYEAFASFAIFVILIFIHKKYSKKLPKLFITFLYVFLYFSARFIIEYWKDLHVFAESFPLSMGQVLSIIPILLALIYFTFNRDKLSDL